MILMKKPFVKITNPLPLIENVALNLTREIKAKATIYWSLRTDPRTSLNYDPQDDRYDKVIRITEITKSEADFIAFILKKYTDISKRFDGLLKKRCRKSKQVLKRLENKGLK